jgi:hypothetical protein
MFDLHFCPKKRATVAFTCQRRAAGRHAQAAMAAAEQPAG